MRVDPMADPVFFDIDAVIFSRVLKTTQVREGPHGHGANRRKPCAPIGPLPISQPDQPVARGKLSPTRSKTGRRDTCRSAWLAVRLAASRTGKHAGSDGTGCRTMRRGGDRRRPRGEYRRGVARPAGL